MTFLDGLKLTDGSVMLDRLDKREKLAAATGWAAGSWLRTGKRHQLVCQMSHDGTGRILRQRAHYIGTVEAPDERAAEAAAVGQFNLDEEQRRRLAVREQE
jgi:hypothetical protein